MNPDTEVKALLFDLGGVVIDIDFQRAFTHWQHCSRLPLHELRHRFSMDHAYEQHERGEIDQRTYFDHLRTMLELDASDEDIAGGWNAIFVQALDDALACIAHIEGRLPVFALSNSNPTHQVAWTSGFPQVVEVFDRVFVSSELGVRKPEREAFEAVARATGITLSSTVFFDDTLENVEGARAAGLLPVHVRSAGDVRRALTALAIL